MEIVIPIAIAVIGLTAGFFIGYYLKIKSTSSKASLILEEAKAEAEVVKKEKILQAKEKFLQLKEKHDSQVNDRNKKLAVAENKLKQKESTYNQRKEEFNKKNKAFEIEKNEATAIRKNLETQLTIIDNKKAELDKKTNEQIQILERISGISKEDAKVQLIKSLKAEAKTEAMVHINETLDEARITAKKEATRIVIQTIQRIGTETAIENAVSVLHIANDEMKGRIIGREGRNIRALEAATGIGIVVDDTPESIVLSSFDPLRREVARIAIHQLVTDGRIHPARIEEVVKKTKKQIEEEVLQIGKQTAIDLGIHGLHHQILRLVGKMKYRSSYGQNLLQHSRETARLCAVMAAELGLDAQVAKRAGLLHDLGKVADEKIDIPHAIYGMKLAEKYKEKPEVCNAIGSHHDEIEMTTLIAPLVQVCDAISGSRPRARREVAESYIKRIKMLEDLALSEEGVIKTYAIQAGRELRVIVGSNKVSDGDIDQISQNIAKRIEEEMTYPGQVKITVIRENRAVSYAK